MLRRLRPALLLAAVALVGCFDIVSTVTVRPDGSAVVRDSVAFSLGDLLDESMQPDKEALRARAAALGEGVTLVGVATWEGGYTALYSVADVGALTYSLPDLDLGEDASDETVADGPLDLTFAFERGEPSTLSIVVPDDDGGIGRFGAGPPSADEAREMRQAFGFMRAMLGEAHVAVRVKVEGDVVESDAAYREASTVTLAEFAFADLIDGLEASPEVLSGEDGGFRALLAESDAARVQQAGTVTVRFR